MKNNKKISTAVIYTRYSPRPRRPKQGDCCHSCETQLMYNTEYCKFHKLEIVGTFSDEALSGKSRKNRPGLEKALVRVKKYKSVLVIYSFSRLARNTKEMLEIVEEIRDGGGDLASLHEKIDSTSPMGQLMFTIMVALSQFEREQIAERTREAMKAHMKAGRMMGSKPPYGWKQDPANPKRMLKEAFEQESLEIMLKMRRAGSSYNVIMKYMEFKNRKGRNGKPWDVGTLGAILRRELAEQQCPL